MSTNNLQPYGGFTSHGGAYHSDDVRRILAEVHAHYEAQVRRLGGLAQPDDDAGSATSPHEVVSQMRDALQFVVRHHDHLKPGDIVRLRSIIAKAMGTAS
jgi:hypothetical protein